MLNSSHLCENSGMKNDPKAKSKTILVVGMKGSRIIDFFGSALKWHEGYLDLQYMSPCLFVYFDSFILFGSYIFIAFIF